MNNGVKLTWQDGHVSLFDFDWLKKRNFTKENREEYLKTEYRLPPKLWSKNEFESAYKKFEYKDVMQDDKALRHWLEALTVHGCALLTGVPRTEQEVRRLIDRVGFIRQTHYGQEFFVRAKEGTNNVAYLSAPLQMHNDLPYYEYVPGITILHCIEQTKSPGAFSLLTDAFYAAARLKSERPDCFKCLTETLVNWNDYGVEDNFSFRSIYRAPVIW